MQIVSPPDTVDSGAITIPIAQVQNLGNTTVTFPINLKIGSSYNEQRNKTLISNQIDTINFASWSAGLRGHYAIRCSTALSGDIISSNNKLLDTVIVRVSNIGVTQIIAPIDSFDSTAIIYPRAKVKNYGSTSALFNVTFKIGNYSSTRSKILGSNIEDTVNFAQWIPSRGNFSGRCSTSFDGDLVKSNDTMSARVHIRVSDVGIVGIISPTNVVDSGVSLTPKVLVKNYGNQNEVFPIILKIGDDFYETKTETLSSGLIDTVEFNIWSPVNTASNAISCSTKLIGDMNPTNNTVNDSVFIRTADVGVLSITAPTGSFYYGDVVIPSAEIKNFGNQPETFSAVFKLSTYSSLKIITIDAGAIMPVYFDTCRLRMSGSIIGQCSTAIAGDIRPDNNILACSIYVRCRDVSVNQIITPSATIDSTEPISPVIQVNNNGTDSATFYVTLKIDSTTHNIYTYMRQKFLGPNTSDTMIFQPLNLCRGNYTARCSTYLDDDSIKMNDTLSKAFMVRVRNIDIMQIVSPTDTVDSGVVVIPTIRIGNYGNTNETLSVTLRFGTNYTSTRNKFLLAGQIDTVNFVNFQPVTRGNITLRCTSAYFDSIHTVFVRIRDWGVTRIISPSGTIDTSTNITPQAKIKNYGNVNYPVYVWYKIYRDGDSTGVASDDFRTLVYSDSINLTIQHLDSMTALFRNWHPPANGSYSLLSFVASDMQSRNDSAISAINVTGIQEEQDLGVLPKEFKLGNNYPNPFFLQTIINYALPKDCYINLKIYNASGQIVRILKDKNEKAGFYRINWDSRDETGKIVPAGIYFYSLETNEYIATRKMLMLR